MKPSLRPAVILTLAFVLPLSVPALAAELALPTPGALTCQGPIRPGDTAASLKARYGAAAEVVTVDGPEGQPTQVLMLWGQDKRLRMEVRFWDDAMTRLAAVQPYADSQWTIAGLAVGDPYQKVEKLNGRPFRFSGFDWDYGGYVTALGGGKLAELPGGGGLLRLDPAGPAGRGIRAGPDAGRPDAVLARSGAAPAQAAGGRAEPWLARAEGIALTRDMKRAASAQSDAAPFSSLRMRRFAAGGAPSHGQRPESAAHDAFIAWVETQR